MPLGAAGAASLTEIAPGSITVFRAEHQSFFALPLGRTPLDSWDLAGIAARGGDFVTHWQSVLARPDFHRLSGPEALRPGPT